MGPSECQANRVGFTIHPSRQARVGRALVVAGVLAAMPAAAQVVACDTCGSIALQGPLESCTNDAACFSALLHVGQTVSEAQATAQACAATHPEEGARAAAVSDALDGYLRRYQGDDILDTLDRWRQPEVVADCDVRASANQIDRAIHVVEQLLTLGCNGALPRDEPRAATLPARSGAASLTASDGPVC